MSLFWLKEQKSPAPTAGRRAIALRSALPPDQSKLSCRQCSLDKEPLTNPKMLPTGAAKPIFYVLGEAPGKQEDEQAEQFVGKSGALLRDRLPSKWAKHIRWNNTIRCRPPANRDPSSLELGCCRRLQEDDIAAAKPKVILAFGAIALQWLTRNQPLPAGLGGGRQYEQAAERGLPAITNWRGRRLPVRVGGHTCWAYVFGHPAWLLRLQNDKKMGKAHIRTFERDLARVFSDYGAGLPEPFVEDPADYRKGIELLLDHGAAGVRRIKERLAELAQRPDVTIDIETNGIKPYKVIDPKLLSCAIGNYEDTFAFGLDHPEAQWTSSEREQIFELLNDFLLRSGRKWAHFLKFEQEWLRYFFDDHILYKTEWGDTHAQAHTIDERPAKALDDITLLHFGFNLKQISNLDIARLVEYPLDQVLLYNALDTKYTDAARVVQSDLLDGLGLTETYEKFARLTPSLVRMQAKGLTRNVPQIILLNDQLQTEENRIKRAILEHKDVAKFRNVRTKFSPASNPDLLAFFHDFLKFDVGNVDEEVLGSIDHPVAALVVKMRTEAKLRSTYVMPLLDGGKHVARDGMVHANFNHTLTVTTRLSSDDPNAQNFPRRERKEIRSVIGVPPGNKFVSCDFGQLEARVVAMMSKDKTLVAETRNGDDIHGVWADKIGACFIPKKLKEKDGRKWVRDAIKNLWTFPNFFGAAPGAIAQYLSQRFEIDISERTLRPFYDEFWDKYQGVLRWQEQEMNLYWERGYVETATGFRRHEPMSRNEIINHPVQGSASQIVLDAQLRIDRLAYDTGRESLRAIMNVHDDLSFYLPLETLEQDIEDIAREMCCCAYSWINVPLAVEVSLGDNWADKEELTTFTTKDFK